MSSANPGGDIYRQLDAAVGNFSGKHMALVGLQTLIKTKTAIPGVPDSESIGIKDFKLSSAVSVEGTRLAIDFWANFLKEGAQTDWEETNPWKTKTSIVSVSSGPTLEWVDSVDGSHYALRLGYRIDVDDSETQWE